MSKRVRRGRAFWEATVVAWQGSGATVAAFCEDRELSVQTFYAWKRRLAVEELEGDGTPPAFVPVRVVDRAANDVGRADRAIEIVLSNGRVVRVGDAFDEPTLQRVIVALEALPC
jgi:hypothetical protein